MATLVIKGHPTRGKEVIQLLEMFGGKSNGNIKGYNDDLYYYIAKDGLIYGSGIEYEELACNYSLFTLEDFVEKFPYKVGDKVTLDKYPCIITEMYWEYDDVIYYLKSDDFSKGVYSTDKDLQPYKEETNMEDNKVMGSRIDFSLTERIELDLGDTHEVVVENGKTYVVKKKPTYPKTYSKCCKVLGFRLGDNIDNLEGYKSNLLEHLQALLICRDAYWKIAGEEMNLGKPWEPDWNNGLNKCCLKNCESRIVRCALASSNALLAFPTKEMRDAFFENFKGLIEKCKELL